MFYFLTWVVGTQMCSPGDNLSAVHLRCRVFCMTVHTHTSRKGFQHLGKGKVHRTLALRATFMNENDPGWWGGKSEEMTAFGIWPRWQLWGDRN